MSRGSVLSARIRAGVLLFLHTRKDPAPLLADIHCCIDIPVHTIPTSVAIDPLIEPQFLFYAPTPAAFPARRIEPPDPDYFFSTVIKLVPHHLPERAITVIHDALPEPEAPAHRLHVEILHRNGVIRVRDLPAQLMQEILSLVTYFLMAPGQPFPLFFIITAPLFA